MHLGKIAWDLARTYTIYRGGLGGNYHISKSKAVGAAFTDHGSESPECEVGIKEVGRPAICQYYCTNISPIAR